jgi:hypothetical protein
MSLFGRNNTKKDEVIEPVAPPVSLATPPAPAAPPPPATPIVVAVEAIKPPPPPEPPTLAENKTLDFQAIYKFSRLPETAFTAEQTLAMLEQLPHAMPLEMKRQTVQVTLGALGTAIGATQVSIVADADKKRTTLQQYADAQGKKTDATVAEAENQIAELQRQIARKESEIATAKDKQACIRNLCDTESARLESVLSFFSDEAPAEPVATEQAPVTLTLEHEDEDIDILSSFTLEEGSSEAVVSEEPPLRIAA